MGWTALYEAELRGFLDGLGRGTPRGPSLGGAARRLTRADPVTEPIGRLGVDLVAAAAGRVELCVRSMSLCPALRLEVAGHAVEAALSDVELWRFYLPICQTVAALLARGSGRVLVGIAGAGGSGKSVFAGLLMAVMQRALRDAASAVALCTMDGFHYPNAYLDSHYVHDGEGRRVPLRALKGTPETFDAQSFVRCVRDLKGGAGVTVPRYDRRLHDPAPDGGRIGPEQRAVLVEGNYLLLDEGAWADVADLLDLKLFLAAPPEAVREAIIRRHMRGGRSADDAARHFERVDEPNCRLIAATAHRADVLILRDAAHRVVSIERPPAPWPSQNDT